MISPHPLVTSSAPQSSTKDRGVLLSLDACKRCDFCWTRQYGCTATRCYCHSHQLEPEEAL